MSSIFGTGQILKYSNLNSKGIKIDNFKIFSGHKNCSKLKNFKT